MQKKKHDQLRIRDSLTDLHIQLQKRNKTMTPKELDAHEKFEDVSEALSNKDKIGKVFKKPTSEIHNSRNSGYFDNF